MDAHDFANAVETHSSHLYRLARRIAPPGVDADDLVQETFERAWRNRERFRGQASIATWLHSILVNRARDHTRAWIRVRDTTSERLASDARLLDLSVEEPTQVIARAEREDEMRAALARLPLPERSALALHDGEGFATSEVAQMLNCSEAAAYKRIQRARFRLAGILDLPGEARRPPLSCRSARRSASAYLDGELPTARAREVEEHLQACQHCPPVMQAIIGIRNALGQTPGRPLPEPTLKRLRETVKLEGLSSP